MDRSAAVIDLDAEEAPAPSRARTALLKRLADVVCLPSSRVNSFERAVTGDLLVEMLRTADLSDRVKVATRLAALIEAPGSVMRLLLRDDVQVARPLLENSPAVNDSDLITCAYAATMEHRLLIARRREVSEAVCDVLVNMGETPVLEALLKNEGARFSYTSMDAVTAASRLHEPLTAMILRRPELRPAQAYVMFWWCEADCRRAILTRFAVSREVMQEAAGDVFALAMAEEWQDPVSRKALQFIERRQRNRKAIERSPYDSLEDAVAAAQAGLTRELVSEISYLAGLKPTTGAKLITDSCGEPLAILCKATGLPRSAVRALWRAMRRPETDSTGKTVSALERTLIVYDMLAVDRAQTVLRYWNWALSSALTPALIRAIREGDEAAMDEASLPQRAAMLAMQGDFGRA